MGSNTIPFFTILPKRHMSLSEHLLLARAVRPLAQEKVPALGEERCPPEIAKQLADLSPADLFEENALVDADAARCCLSGLWLLHGDLNTSHEISQQIETADGSFWHGIMHRREGDFSNAKYWFRQVGSHACFSAISTATRHICVASTGLAIPPAAQKLSMAWQPNLFVDYCQAIMQQDRAGESAQAMLCRKIARAEWDALFEYCCRKAIGAK